jgi:hypothetical protein
MCILKNLLFQSIALTLVLTGFNVYAVDQSICNPGVNVFFHNNGSLKACQLKNDFDANNIQCKKNYDVSFYANGNLESCVLTKPATIAKNKCEHDRPIYFYSDGKLKSCVKQEN